MPRRHPNQIMGVVVQTLLAQLERKHNSLTYELAQIEENLHVYRNSKQERDRLNREYERVARELERVETLMNELMA